MNARTVALGVGTAMTTFLVAGAATIELLGAGEAPAIGVLGVLVGVVAGLLAGGIVSVYADRLPSTVAAVVAYATFGVVFVTIAGASYLDAPYVDSVLTFRIHVAVSVSAAAVVGLLTHYRRRDGPTTA